MKLLVEPLHQAQARAGFAGAAPELAQRLRAQGTPAVCLLDAEEGRDWLDTPHASGWIEGRERASAEMAGAVGGFLAQGFVAADAVLLACMLRPRALPLLSWDAQPPTALRELRPAQASRPLDLYAIVDSARRLRDVLDAGVRTVQLRIKTPPAPDAAWNAMLREEIADAVAASRACGAQLFVNDHWRVAHALGAAGVHLGQEDLAALGAAGRAELRATGLALGVSSHSAWELARARSLAPAYIACGPVWPTLTKDMPWLPQGLDNLAWWRAVAGVPVTAIGGILAPEQVEQAAGTGVDGVCIVRGLGADPRSTVPLFEAALTAGRARKVDVPAWPHPTLPH